MTDASPLTIAVPMIRRPLPAGFARRAELSCPGCGAGTTLHQPLVDRPDLLLATCASCRAWTVVTILPGEQETLLAVLPDPGILPDRS